MTQNPFKLYLEEADESLNLREFCDFIYLFQAVYGLACRELDGEVDLETSSPSDAVLAAETLQGLASNLGLGKLSALLDDENLPTLNVTLIKKESPIEIYVVGATTAIVIAVILSGGEIEAPFLKAKLKPLGDGIKSLREAFGLRQEERIGYTVRGRLIRLSRAEYEQLMVEVNGQGGFQTLFRELQARTHVTTRAITLHAEDIDRVRRSGKDPAGGGFQRRLRSIFGSHVRFDDDSQSE